ncbi:MAG: ribosome silencing factor [Bacilli bacterium]
MMQDLITKLIEKKAEDVVLIDTTPLTPYYDECIIATALNQRHIKSLIEFTEDYLIENGLRVKDIQGTPDSEWMIIDAYDTIIHILTDNERTRLSLDQIIKRNR